MAGKRKTPKLRMDGKYYVVSIYKPNGQRTNISFGSTDERTEGEIYTAFGKWLDLFKQQPQKTLSFKNPYEAIEQIFNPMGIITIDQLLDKYLQLANDNMRPDRNGNESPDIRKIKRTRRFLETYHNWPFQDFGPYELRAVQKKLVRHEYRSGKTKKRYTRRGVNDTIKWIRHIWEWGMGRQIVKIEQIQSLKEVKPLKMGQLSTVDKTKRRRVTKEEFQKVIKAVSSVVGDILQLIWYTGMRPYEACEIRPYDILTDDPKCWLYIPGRDKTPVGGHKTAHFGRVKVIPLTKEPKKILASRIKDFDSKEYIFSPKEAVQELLGRKAASRKTPLKCGNRPGTNKNKHPMVQPGKKYNSNSLCHACKRGCERAGVEVFVPYDLRRTMATGTRSILGKEAARVLLGHTKTDTTDIYLLEEVQEAIKVAKLLDSIK